MARFAHSSIRGRVKKLLLIVARCSLRNRPALSVGAAMTLAISRLGPRWAERIRIFTFNGLVVGTCEDVIVDVHRQGLQLKLNLSDNLQRCLFFCGTYEDDFLGYLKRNVRPGDI